MSCIDSSRKRTYYSPKDFELREEVDDDNRDEESPLAFDLEVPAQLRKQWRVKIRDKETREPPHITILRKTDAWRINLRTGKFMDTKPSPDEVPEQLLKHIQSTETWKKLCEEWDRMYSNNPVKGEDN